MLTTGRLKAALGLHDRPAAAALGLHPNARGSSHLQEAYQHLLSAAARGSSDASDGFASAAGAAAEPAAAACANEAARQLFMQQLAAGQQEALELVGTITSAEEARSASERAAVCGDVALKVAWGKTQEAAALLCVLLLFPAALLEEVGLFEVCPTACARLAPDASLPRLGASPDGTLAHRLVLQPGELLAAASLLDEHPQRAVRELLSAALQRVACAGATPRRGVPLADTSSDASDAGSDGGGGCDSSSGSGDDEPPEVQPAAAGGDSDARGGSSSSSTPARLQHSADSNGSQASAPAAPASEPLTPQEAGSLAFAPVARTVQQLLREVQQTQRAGGTVGPATLIVREVIEVKNHCVYGLRQRKAGRRGRTLAWAFSPRGAATRLQPHWVPQLQLHMLATGCESALLVSRCAERGVSVFRAWRDEAYLTNMLQLLSVLQAQHVARGQPPPPGALSRLALHRAFVARTAALAREAHWLAVGGEELVARVPREPGNQAQFWPAR